MPFAYILDMACVNVSTLFALNNKKNPLKQDLFVFGMSVVFGLVGPFIKRHNQSRLSPCIKTKIALTLGMMSIRVANVLNPNTNAAPFPSLNDKKKRFKRRIEEMEPGENEKSIAPQKSFFQFCGNHSCQKYLVHICDSCKEARS